MNSICNQLFQYRQTRLCFAVAVVLSAFILPTSYAGNDALDLSKEILNLLDLSYSDGLQSTYSSSVSSAEYLLPCSYWGNIIRHGEERIVDDCTTCICDNSTLKCDIQSCPSIYCDHPVRVDEKDDGYCCAICDSYAPIWKVTPEHVEVVDGNVVFDLRAHVNAEGSHVKGQGLWKAGVWASASADGDGERISYTEQVLSETHSATEMIRANFFGDFDFIIDGIEYSLNVSDALDICSELRYLCVEFAKGDEPHLKDPRPIFTVEGVAGADDRTPSPKALQGCTLFPACRDVPTTQASTTHKVSTYEGSGETLALDFSFSDGLQYSSSSSSAGYLLPCSYRGNIILHGEQHIVNDCTTCICDNSTVKCDIRSCPSILCDEPINLEGVCCDTCPYYVPVWKVTPDTIYSISEGQKNHINFDLRVDINGAGLSVRGEGLWKVGVWASRNAVGKGKRIGYKEQILSQEQAATALIRPHWFGGFVMNIPDIEYSLNAKTTRCSNMQYLCVEFAKGDDPRPQEPRVPFTVEGVWNENKLRSTPRNLQGCIPFPGCKDVYGDVVY